MKKTNLFIIAMLMTSAMTVAGQGNNSVLVSETRTSKPYHFIQIKGEMNVKIVEDEMPGVTIEGSKYQLDNTVTLLRHDTLLVYQTNTRARESKAYVTINVDNVSFIEVNGKSKVDCSGLINADFLTIRAHNGARVKLDVRALKVDSKATGCSFIDLSGIVEKQIKYTDETSYINSNSLEVMYDKGTLVKMCGVC